MDIKEVEATYPFTDEDYKAIDQMDGGVGAPQNPYYYGVAKVISLIEVECQQRVRANLTLLVAEIQDCKDMVGVNQLLDCWIKANTLEPEKVETYKSLVELQQALKKIEGVK